MLQGSAAPVWKKNLQPRILGVVFFSHSPCCSHTGPVLEEHNVSLKSYHYAFYIYFQAHWQQVAARWLSHLSPAILHRQGSHRHHQLYFAGILVRVYTFRAPLLGEFFLVATSVVVQLFIIGKCLSDSQLCSLA